MLTAARRAGLRELLSADTGGRLKVTSVGLKVFERQAAQVGCTLAAASCWACMAC